MEGKGPASCARRESSKRLAAEGKRAWMTGRLSIQEAQYAAWRSAVASRKPKPPKRSGKCAARSDWGGSGASAWPRSVARQRVTAES